MGSKKFYIKENEVRFRQSPETIEGAKLLSRGQELEFVDGPWLKVKLDNEVGWVHIDYLTEINSNSVQIIQQVVQFINGQANNAASEITKKVREIISDEFGLGKIGENLNCTEYVMYQIKMKTGVMIQWPMDRPRNGGKWADIFERNKLYKILSKPQVNCAMCFTSGISINPEVNEVGHVAFVEAVLSNNSIKISEANWPRDGIYSERIISKNDWQNKYKARFINFI